MVLFSLELCSLVIRQAPNYCSPIDYVIALALPSNQKLNCEHEILDKLILPLNLCAGWSVLQGPDADCSWFSVLSFAWQLRRF